MLGRTGLGVAFIVLAAAAAACSSESSGRATGTGGTMGSGGSGPGTGGGNSSGGSGPGLGGSPGGGFQSSLPGDLVIQDMTDSQFAQACAEWQAYMANLAGTIADASCRGSGVMEAAMLLYGGAPPSDAQLQSTCQAAYDACLLEPPAPSTCERPAGTCTATVAQATQCLNDQAAMVPELAAAIPACADLTVPVLTAFAANPPPATEPASCLLLDDPATGNCPGWMGGSSAPAP